MIMGEENVESISPEHSGCPSFEKILVAYDETEISKRALSYAAYFSKVSDSEIVVINVVKSDRDFKGLPLTIKANREGKEEQEQEQQPAAGGSQSAVLQEIVKEMTTTCKAAGLTKKITFEIRTGNPADEIINISNLMRFDLIIMGSRRIASKIEVIGSTTRKVITKVKTPLLIVHKQPTYKDEY
jgi:nucleotide-binding universal stress UspA family protein